MLGKRRAEGREGRGKEQQIDDARAISEVTSLPIPPPKKNILFSFSASLFIFHVWETGVGGVFLSRKKAFSLSGTFPLDSTLVTALVPSGAAGQKEGETRAPDPLSDVFFKTEM